MDKTKTKQSVYGRIKFLRSPDTKCTCCDGGHIFNKEIVLDDFGSELPSFFGLNVKTFVGTFLQNSSLENKRIKLTIEIIEDE